MLKLSFSSFYYFRFSNIIYTFLNNDVFCFQADGEDELKKRQLMELAIINGTYRDSESMRALAAVGEFCTISTRILF